MPRERDAAPPDPEDVIRPPGPEDEPSDDEVDRESAAVEAGAERMAELEAMGEIYQARTERLEMLVMAADNAMAALGFPVLGVGGDSAVSASHQQDLDSRVRAEAKRTAIAVLQAIRRIAEDDHEGGAL